ncbi:unnamed protein product, partial [Heterotrigona itama]
KCRMSSTSSRNFQGIYIKRKVTEESHRNAIIAINKMIKYYWTEFVLIITFPLGVKISL